MKRSKTIVVEGDISINIDDDEKSVIVAISDDDTACDVKLTSTEQSHWSWSEKFVEENKIAHNAVLDLIKCARRIRVTFEVLDYISKKED
jgi:hypothetical protein